MTTRKGFRRAQVLAVLSDQPQKIGQLVKATGLKWQIVENVLDAPSVACLVDVGADGYSLRQTAEAVQEQSEALARVQQQAMMFAVRLSAGRGSVQTLTQPVNPEPHSTVSSEPTLPGSLKASPRVRGA